MWDTDVDTAGSIYYDDGADKVRAHPSHDTHGNIVSN